MRIFIEMVNISPEVSAFLSQHAFDDTTRLLLSAKRYPGIDVRWAVEQIEARRQLKTKLPEWYAAADRLIMGGRVPAEQCSSEQTARYKQQLVEGGSLCDLTGGMGVDCYYMSQGIAKAIYTERQPHLCDAARHNFATLGATHIEVREGDAFELGIPDVDTIYLDPARRAHDGSRVYDLADCEPNVVEYREELLSHCKRLIIKISPMADLSRVLQQMPGVSEIHIVAVKNECKELLLVIDVIGNEYCDGPMVHCIDFRSQDVVRFDYAWHEEQGADIIWIQESTPTSHQYLYEPDVTLLKAGAFKLPCMRYGVQKVDVNSHLYVSEVLVKDFPGRIFQIDEMIDFSSKNMKRLGVQLPKANVATRNFPLTADMLRKRAGIRDGGETYLFGTTLAHLGAKLLSCHKAVLVILLMIMLPSLVFARKKKSVPQETLADILQNVKTEAPCMWNQGSEFLYLDDKLNASLRPLVPDVAYDTLNYKNSIWTFDGIISEEDWMGVQCMHLQFYSPQGRLYRFATGRKMSQANDTAYRPALSSLCALDPIRACDSTLRGKSLYLMINDDRVYVAKDSARMEKFVPVRIDSVSVGNELAPLRVWFTHPSIGSAFVLTSLPDSRENATSTSIMRFFSLSDPYLKYPNITPEIWSLIRVNRIKTDMTLEEVRLSLGRPQRYEHYNTKNGMIEVWHYADRIIVEFVDGRMRRTALER